MGFLDDTIPDLQCDVRVSTNKSDEAATTGCTHAIASLRSIDRTIFLAWR